MMLCWINLVKLQPAYLCNLKVEAY